MAAVTGNATSAERGSWALPLLAGVLVGVSYFPGPFLPLNLAGMVPLLLWLESRPSATPYERLRAGFVFGLATHLVSMHFMYSMLAHSWLAVLLYLGFAAALGLRIALSVVLMDGCAGAPGCPGRSCFRSAGCRWSGSRHGATCG